VAAGRQVRAATRPASLRAPGINSRRPSCATLPMSGHGRETMIATARVNPSTFWLLMGLTEGAWQRGHGFPGARKEIPQRNVRDIDRAAVAAFWVVAKKF
jgi:hypothetical protein